MSDINQKNKYAHRFISSAKYLFYTIFICLFLYSTIIFYYFYKYDNFIHKSDFDIDFNNILKFCIEENSACPPIGTKLWDQYIYKYNNNYENAKYLFERLEEFSNEYSDLIYYKIKNIEPIQSFFRFRKPRSIFYFAKGKLLQGRSHWECAYNLLYDLSKKSNSSKFINSLIIEKLSDNINQSFTNIMLINLLTPPFNTNTINLLSTFLEDNSTTTGLPMNCRYGDNVSIFALKKISDNFNLLYIKHEIFLPISDGINSITLKEDEILHYKKHIKELIEHNRSTIDNALSNY